MLKNDIDALEAGEAGDESSGGGVRSSMPRCQRRARRVVGFLEVQRHSVTIYNFSQERFTFEVYPMHALVRNTTRSTEYCTPRYPASRHIPMPVLFSKLLRDCIASHRM